MGIRFRLTSVFTMVVLFGCDRVAYEARNSSAAKSASSLIDQTVSTYRNANRIPVADTEQACLDRKNGPDMGSNIESCMKNGGYTINQKWKQAEEFCYQQRFSKYDCNQDGKVAFLNFSISAQGRRCEEIKGDTRATCGAKLRANGLVKWLVD